MASFKAKFPVLQELFAKKPQGGLWPPPPSGARVTRSNISHTEKEQAVATPVLRLFGRAQGISIGHENYLLASGKIVRVVMSRHDHSHFSLIWWAGQ